MAPKVPAKQPEKQLPVDADLLADLGQAAEQYVEAMGKDDMSIPFIQILQSLSPQCTKGEPEFIKGSEPSMLYNTVTKELRATQDDDGNQLVGMRIISLAYKASYIEWVPRSKGGGFVAEYDVGEGAGIPTHRNENNQDIISDGAGLGTPGNQLSYTHTHFVFIVGDDGSLEPAVLTMTSTQVKPSKDWNALIMNLRLPNGAKAPRFFGVWNVSTRRRSNDQGSWYVWEISKGSDITALPNARQILNDCKAFVDGIQAGEHTADYTKENPATPSGGGDPEGDDDIPF